MPASSPPVFRMRFNRDTGKYEGVDIHAELQKLQAPSWGGGGGGYAAVELGQAEFSDTDGYLLYDVRYDDGIAIARTTLREEFYERSDLRQLVSQPMAVRVAVTAPADASGMPQVIRPIVAICQVRFDPVPHVARLVAPTPEEMPLPAVADGRVPVTLQVFDGPKGPPVSGLQVTFRPGSRARRFLGTWEPSSVAGVTDQNGEVSFFYAPPDLLYRPGGVYSEEVIATAGEGDDAPELLRFALPLAPRLQFRIAAQKVRELEPDAPVGITLEPAEISIDADERVKAIETVLRVQGLGSGPQREPAVAFAPLAIELFDGEEYAPLSQATSGGGRVMETGDHGRHLWSLPELAQAYGGRLGTTFRLDPSAGAIDLSQLSAAAAQVADDYEHTVLGFCPFDLLSADLGARLKEYPGEYCGQLAARSTDDYERIVAASETLRIAAGYVLPYQRFYEAAKERTSDDLKNVFTEALGLAINMVQLGDMLRDGSAHVARLVESRRWVQRGLDWFQGTIVANLRRAARALLEVAQRARSYAAPYFRQALQALDNMVGRTIREMSAPAANVRELLNQVMGWIGDLLRAMANALLSILAVVLDVLVRCLSGLLESLGLNLESVNSVAYQYAADAFQRAFHLDGPQGFVLSKLYEYAAGALSKALGEFSQEAMGALVTGAVAGPGALVVTLLSKLNWLGPLASCSVGDVHMAASKLEIEPEYEDKTGFYRDLTNAFRGVQQTFNSAMHEIDEGLAWLDMLLLAGQALLAVIVTISSWGLGAALMTKMTAVDVAWSKIKLCTVRIPQLAAGLGFQLAVLTVFALGTYQMLT